MEERNLNVKKTDESASSSMSTNNNEGKSNEESQLIQNEAACSPEFSEGCIIMDDV